jgi:hypothetical protein
MFFHLIISFQIASDKVERSYYLTQKDGRVWLENEVEEGMVITEVQLFKILDKYFRKEL